MASSYYVRVFLRYQALRILRKEFPKIPIAPQHPVSLNIFRNFWELTPKLCENWRRPDAVEADLLWGGPRASHGCCCLLLRLTWRSRRQWPWLYPWHPPSGVEERSTRCPPSRGRRDGLTAWLAPPPPSPRKTNKEDPMRCCVDTRHGPFLSSPTQRSGAHPRSSSRRRLIGVMRRARLPQLRCVVMAA